MKKNSSFLFILVMSLSAKAQVSIQPDFSANPLSGCQPLTVSFTDLSAGNPTFWMWDFGNGNTSTIQNPSASYLSAGVYTVKLKISDGASTDSIIKVNYITVYAKPEAHFTISPAIICEGESVTFTDSSVLGSGPIASWYWSFGDGFTQTTTTGVVVHTYAASGFPPVTLNITDIHGCVSSDTGRVTVIKKPLVNFSGTPLNSCSAPLNVTFTDASIVQGAANYTWYFGDGTTSALQNPQHNYTSAGSYTVTLVITNGLCTDSLTFPNYVNILSSVADFTVNDSLACVGQQLSFTNTSVPASVTELWNFGDGNTSPGPNPTHIYLTAGTYTVTLTVTDINGCNATKTKTSYIIVTDSPVISYTANDSTYCYIPALVNFNATASGPVTWFWDFAGQGTSTLQNPTHTFNSQGLFNINLTATNPGGCSTLISMLNIQVSEPQSAFEAIPLSGCVPLQTTFYSQSISLADPVVSYFWNFGNGQTQTSANGIGNATYNTVGLFTVTLIITTLEGCSDTTVYTNYIETGNPPNTNFTSTPDTVCFGVPVTFTNLTNPIDSLLWIYGDFSSSGFGTAFNIDYIYTTIGTFNVTLITCNSGCCDTLTIDSMTTVLPPIAQFSSMVDCNNPFHVDFLNASVQADSVVWNFGDGTSDVTNNNAPSHTYTATGTYGVVITAYNFATGCVHSDTVPIYIVQLNAAFVASPTIGCYPLEVYFDASATTGAVSYFWNFGNGVTHTTLNTTDSVIYYSLGGYFDVTLIVTDVNGCKDTMFVNDLVHPHGSIMNFSANPLVTCAPATITFTDSTTNELPIVNWLWNFYDGPLVNTTTPVTTHTYLQPGHYSVTLTVTDSAGCNGFLGKNLYVHVYQPKPAFTLPATACMGEPVTINASATQTTQTHSVGWNFDDGTTSTDTTKIFTHTFQNAGTFNVSFTVTDSIGCDSTIVHTIVVSAPVASFTVDTTLSCGLNAAIFHPDTTGNLSAYQWYFSNGATASIQTPSINFNVAGYYSVSLVVTDAAGCKDSLHVDSIIVVPGPYGSFTFTPVNGCAPLLVQFTVNATNITSYLWDFGDGDTSNLSSPSHLYANDLTATPSLTLVGLFNGLECLQPAVNLTGSINVQTIQSVQIYESGTTPDTIYLSPGQSVNLIAQAVNASSVNYSWTGLGLSCTNCQNPVVTAAGSSTMLVVTATQPDGGCSKNDTLYIVYTPCIGIALQIKNDEGFDMSDTLFISNGQTVQLNGNVTGGTSLVYFWTPPTGLSCTNCPVTVLIGSNQNSWYVLSVDDAGGCTLLDSVYIVSNELLCDNLYILPNVFTPNGDFLNDLFYISGACPVDDYLLTIYNRWGQELFKTSNPAEGWNGKNKKGNDVTEGTYYFILHVKGKNSHGHFALIRN